MVDRLDLVAEQVDPVGGLGVGREDLQHLALGAEGAAGERGLVARVLHPDELAEELVAVDPLADLEQLHLPPVELRRADPEDARDRGDDDHVAAGEQRGGRGVAQAVDLVVDRGVLLDVEVLRRDVGLGLVVVVVADEVLDLVLGEELAELVAELRGERLVVGDHQRRALDPLDHPGHRERLPGPGRAEQGDELLAGVEPLGDRLDRLRLVGGRRVGGVELELGHPDDLTRGPDGRTGPGGVPLGARDCRAARRRTSRRRLEDPRVSRSPGLLAAFFTFAGTMHFVRRARLRGDRARLHPDLGRGRGAWSGYAEIAGGLAAPPRRPAGSAAGGCSGCWSRSSRPTSTWRSTPRRWRRAASRSTGSRGGCSGRGSRSSPCSCAGSGAPTLRRRARRTTGRVDQGNAGLSSRPPRRTPCPRSNIQRGVLDQRDRLVDRQPGGDRREPAGDRRA